MGENAFSTLDLKCPEKPREEETRVFEEVLRSKETFVYGRIPAKKLAENLEKLEKIREFWEFQKKSLELPETSTITTDPHVVEIIELLTQEKIDNNLLMEKLITLPVDIDFTAEEQDKLQSPPS